jgi:hypothetical protein
LTYARGLHRETYARGLHCENIRPAIGSFPLKAYFDPLAFRDITPRMISDAS